MAPPRWSSSASDHEHCGRSCSPGQGGRVVVATRLYGVPADVAVRAVDDRPCPAAARGGSLLRWLPHRVSAWARTSSTRWPRPGSGRSAASSSSRSAVTISSSGGRRSRSGRPGTGEMSSGVNFLPRSRRRPEAIRTRAASPRPRQLTGRLGALVVDGVEELEDVAKRDREGQVLGGGDRRQAVFDD
jgi:hypothetical protein